MTVRVFSLYWDNIDERIPHYQKKVMDMHKIDIFQHRINGMNHGEWMDWVLLREEHTDVVLFLDIDCIILSTHNVQNMLNEAHKGTLFGAAGCANHLDKDREYAGAWFVGVPRNYWMALNKPSAKVTPFCDTAQNLTDTWDQYNIPKHIIYPNTVEVPKWDLPGKPLAYGIGTTYGDVCYHLFESRENVNIERFVTKCKGILGETS
jgi:hypothetical protein